MKKRLLFSALCFICLSAFGQKQEWNIGIGTLSHPTFKEGDFWRGASDGGNDMRRFGPVHVSYKFYLRHNWDVGATALYEHQDHDVTATLPLGNRNHHIYQELFFTFLVHSHYHWLQKGAFDLYSGAGAGIYFNQIKDSRNDFASANKSIDPRGFAYQVTPIGLRIGKKAGGYLELGYGYKGLVSAGFSYRF